jgi:predicted RNA-binding Zn-ribbon protein involved in translation (DUF1610 family)
MAQVKAWPVAEVAARFGLPVARRGVDVSFPCPACGKQLRHTRGGADKRQAARVMGAGAEWWCEPCKMKSGRKKADAVELAAFVVTGKAKPFGAEWLEVRRECAARGLCEPPPADTKPLVARARYVPPPPAPKHEAPKPPPPDEVKALWGACERLEAVPAWDTNGRWCGDVRAYLAARGYDVPRLAALDAARVLPPEKRHAWPGWWPGSWSRTWRLAVPLYGPGGELVALQARAVVEADRKTTNPRGASISGTFFADAGGLEVLRGTWRGPSVALVEGLTDFLAAAQLAADLEPSRRPAVLGLVAGSARALGALTPWRGWRLVVLTDNDEAGDRYAAEVREALPGARGHRVRLPPLVKGQRADLADYLKHAPAKALEALTYGGTQ